MVVIAMFMKKYQIEYKNVHSCNGSLGSFHFLVKTFIKEKKS